MLCILYRDNNIFCFIIYIFYNEILEIFLIILYINIIRTHIFTNASRKVWLKKIFV